MEYGWHAIEPSSPPGVEELCLMLLSVGSLALFDVTCTFQDSNIACEVDPIRF